MTQRPPATDRGASCRRAMLGLFALASLRAAPAAASTYVIPHWIEDNVSTATSAYAFDDFIYLRYTPGLAGSTTGPGATADIYLFDNSTGSPLTIFGTQVCNPCTFDIGGSAPANLVEQIGQLIATRTGFATPVYVGYAMIVLRGADPGGVTLENDLVNSHSGPYDLAVTAFPPPHLRKEDPAFPGGRVFSIPHMLDTPGSTSSATYTFDETLFATYTGGQAGTIGSGGATVSLYLYDESTGLPLTNNGQVVCAPCGFGVGGLNPRKVTIRMEDLITAKGGVFDAVAKRATGVVIMGGADPGNATLQPWLINAHSNAFDLATTAQVAQPLLTSGLLAVAPDDQAGQVRSLGVTPNPAASTVQFSFEQASPGNVDLSVFDVSGRLVSQVFNGRRDPGAHELNWDGLDVAGHHVPGGIYFARLTGADRSVMSRVVMVK